MRLYPPRKTNIFYGYHSKKAHVSQQSWDFAQRLFATLMIKAGIIGILFSTVFIYSPLNTIAELGIIIFYLIFAVVFSKLITEKQLNKFQQNE
jgi:uncharacterized membrane protein